MDDFRSTNRDHWDELADLHPSTPLYDVDGFLDGESSLMDLERDELGSVEGKSLLHLQCHFGMDTLSWAREGATVTGIDFSPKAIEMARELRDEAGIDAGQARFVESDVYELPENLDGEFDIVFTSYGAITWLSDIGRWAEIIDHFLTPGGTFYIAEVHPVVGAVSETNGEFAKFEYPYFSDEVHRFESDEGYASDDKIEHGTTFYWAHTTGDILNALITAGLDIEFVHEFPKICYERFPNLVEGDDGWWRFPTGKPDIPMTLSIRATKRD
ncbi:MULTISPECIES: bifunctional 2-polyprenyl-6-hydroxyphenol methylase/3-demethylubiquinol 3-O-methyltransferase UbiG [Haloferax]|uniref:Methyltransferase domain-containing protein n=2 Tax=Haloferax TaxID=2251 RepID=A0A6G1Z2P8_9EURY|nr:MULTISPECIES: class I SAM-dependent methyltransferase [Haloferax]KAB1188083.1 class I SAM-dependent methyltransferase [Haloferax sp. CBA1149]MRW80755.1 methyltransferase domain-containing protein [Haloferax marinisediminis]